MMVMRSDMAHHHHVIIRKETYAFYHGSGVVIVLVEIENSLSTERIGTTLIMNFIRNGITK